MPALVYGVEGDDVSPLSDLEFLSANRSVELRRIPNASGGALCDADPHLFAFTSCFVADELESVVAFLRRNLVIWN